MDATWPQIPIGVGIAVLLFRELARFLRERDARGPKGNGTSGAKSADFWESKIAELIYQELERHVLPKLNDIIERDKKIWDKLNRWRGRD